MVDRKLNIKFLTDSISMNMNKLAEDLPVELCQYKAIISDLEVKEHATLTLKEREGDFFKGEELKINAKGLSTGLRKKEDGIVNFGLTSKNDKGEIINDFILNTNLKCFNDSSKHLSTLFRIFYRRDNENYFLKMLENDERFFCFVFLCKPQIIDANNGLVISVLSVNFKISVKENKDLQVDFTLGGKTHSKEFEYEKWAKDNKKILIGRKNDCDVFINDSGFSRVQCTIYYKNCNWYIKDGTEDKTSGSGTW